MSDLPTAISALNSAASTFQAFANNLAAQNPLLPIGVASDDNTVIDGGVVGFDTPVKALDLTVTSKFPTLRTVTILPATLSVTVSHASGAAANTYASAWLAATGAHSYIAHGNPWVGSSTDASARQVLHMETARMIVVLKEAGDAAWDLEVWGEVNDALVDLTIDGIWAFGWETPVDPAATLATLFPGNDAGVTTL